LRILPDKSLTFGRASIEMPVLLEALNKDLHRYGSDSRAIVLTLHLHIEYWIDQIISGMSVKREALDGKCGPPTFGTKFSFLKSSKVIQEDTAFARNIQRINNIRNKYAHNIILADIADYIHEQMESMEPLRGETASNTPYLSFDDRFIIRGLETISWVHELYRRNLQPNFDSKKN
jgi:hypothetical protein